jgi:aspartate kinase
MAAALGAEWCEICSDVDGVYTADPRVVPDAKRIGVLSYEETQELAESGAKVLNAQAVEFAKQAGIAIYARATAGPLPGADPSSDGTVVRRHAPQMPGTVVGVASERDVLVVQAAGEADRLLDILDARSVAGKQLHVASYGAAGDGVTMIVPRENLHDESRVRGELDRALGGQVRLLDGLGAVSVVGAGINASHTTVRRGNRALRDAGLAPRGLATSSFRTTWLIDRGRVDDAVRILHDMFIARD